MMLTTDQPRTQQWAAAPLEQRSTPGLIDNLARESALGGQLGSAFTNAGESQDSGSWALLRNNYSSIPFMRSRPAADIPLLTHIKEARRAIGKLVEREQRVEQYKTHQKALAWLAENRGRYRGQWVALQGDELLATGGEARDVYEQVRGLKPLPLVEKIEFEELPFAGW